MTLGVAWQARLPAETARGAVLSTRGVAPRRGVVARERAAQEAEPVRLEVVPGLGFGSGLGSELGFGSGSRLGSRWFGGGVRHEVVPRGGEQQAWRLERAERMLEDLVEGDP